MTHKALMSISTLVAMMVAIVAAQTYAAIGEVDVKTGATAVPSKTTPIFKVAVTKATPPAAATTTS